MSNSLYIHSLSFTRAALASTAFLTAKAHHQKYLSLEAVWSSNWRTQATSSSTSWSAVNSSSKSTNRFSGSPVSFHTLQPVCHIPLVPLLRSQNVVSLFAFSCHSSHQHWRAHPPIYLFIYLSRDKQYLPSQLPFSPTVPMIAATAWSPQLLLAALLVSRALSSWLSHIFSFLLSVPSSST